MSVRLLRRLTDTACGRPSDRCWRQKGPRPFQRSRKGAPVVPPQTPHPPQHPSIFGKARWERDIPSEERFQGTQKRNAPRNPRRISALISKNFLGLEHFQLEMFCISNHTACRFAEKAGFSAHFGPGGAVPPPRVSPVSKLKRSMPAQPLETPPALLSSGSPGWTGVRKSSSEFRWLPIPSEPRAWKTT